MTLRIGEVISVFEYDDSVNVGPCEGILLDGRLALSSVPINNPALALRVQVCVNGNWHMLADVHVGEFPISLAN